MLLLLSCSKKLLSDHCCALHPSRSLGVNATCGLLKMFNVAFIESLLGLLILLILSLQPVTSSLPSFSSLDQLYLLQMKDEALKEPSLT